MGPAAAAAPEEVGKPPTKSTRMTELECELDASRKEVKRLLKGLETTRVTLRELRR